MNKPENYISRILAWFENGTKNQVFCKKALLVMLAFYLMYRLGYVIGLFLSNIGL